jgi:glycosyltransferase involved in cell wall biosynthesis
MISGDRRFGPGHPRYDAQRLAVDELAVIFWGQGALWPRLPHGHFDVVTAQDPLLRGAIGYCAAKIKRARFNVQVHMDFEALPWWKRILAHIVLRHADSVRVVSQNLKAQIGKLAANKKVSVLPVYVDLEQFKNIQHVPHDTKTVLWVGRFEAEKDPLAALDVFKEVQKGIQAKLIMLGAGNLEAKLREQAKNLPVEFPGWQSPLPYLGLADVVLCTSKHESWGQSIVESLAAGVPVVAPDVGIAKEAGAVVVPRERLAQAVAETLRSGTLGRLQIALLPQSEWVQRWRDTLS